MERSSHSCRSGRARHGIPDLTDLYVGKYYGYDSLRFEEALSGNGALLDDGTVSAAEHVQALTCDMSEAKTAIEALVYKQGFAYMAQACLGGEDVPLRRP